MSRIEVEMEHMYEECKHEGKVHEKIEEKENKYRCSKMCAHIVLNITIFTLLALVITTGLIFIIKDSKRMDKIMAEIAELQDKYKRFAAEGIPVIANSSNFVQNDSERMDKIMAEIAELQDKYKNVEKNWLCYSTSCYYFGFEKLNWSTAQGKCHQREAALVEIDSATENEFLLSHRDKLCYSKSDTYRGTESETINGLPCQRWDSLIPHYHTFTGDEFPEGDLSDAANYCRKIGKGGKPWCFTVTPEVEWDYCNVPKCEGVAWIGATDVEEEDTWKWAGSNRLLSMSSFINWNKGEPNNDKNIYLGEDCAHILLGPGDAMGKWNDGHCHSPHGYICKKEIVNK